MRRGVSRGGLIFATVWLAIFAVTFLIWAIYLGNINRRLAEYESVQPKHEAERIFNEYFLNSTASDMIAYEDSFYSEYDKNGAPEAAIKELLDGKQLSFVAETRAIYNVYADGNIVARFTLKSSEERTPLLGARRPILDKIDILVTPTFNITVVAPKSATVKVNGKVVSSDMIEGEPILLDNAEYFPDDEARTMVCYRISGLFAEPSVSIESADGSVGYAVEYDKETYAYSAKDSYISYLRNIYYSSAH